MSEADEKRLMAIIQLSYKKRIDDPNCTIANIVILFFLLFRNIKEYDCINKRDKTQNLTARR